MYLVDFNRHYDILVGETDDIDNNGYVNAESLFDLYKFIPEEDFGIEPPEVRSESIDIPGSMGSRSLVNFLTGYPVFTNRQGSLSFISFEHTPNTMGQLYRKFHGRELNLVMPTNPDYFYTGRFEISKYSIGSENIECDIQYVLQPYLFSRTSSDIVINDDTTVAFIPEGNNTQPYVPIIFLQNETPEYQSSLSFVNEELNINTNVFLQNGINHLGTQVVISNFSGNNENKFTLNRNGGNSKVTVIYRHCMI